jgi:hypothetical protein
MARRLDVDAVDLRWSVERLVKLGVVAVTPGTGGRANLYKPCLPKRIAASMAPAALVDEEVPPF